MKPGAEIRVAIHDLDDDGAGVAEYPISSQHSSNSASLPAGGGADPALEIHVPGTLPGEEVSARVAHLSTHRPVAWATLLAIHRPAAERVNPTCPAYGQCGGCVLQHLDVRAQLSWKEASLRRCVSTEPVLAEVPVAVAVASPRAVGYRNNSKLAAGRDASGELILGGYAPGTHDVVDLAGCSVTEPALEDVATRLRQILRDHSVAPHDERRQTGTLRHAILRANAAGQVLVTLVTATDRFAAGHAVATALVASVASVAGVVQNVNAARGNAIYGPDERLLAGAGAIEDQIGQVRLRISSRAFFQANRLVAAAAYDAIVAGVAPRPTDRVVDAYAGVGGIALTLADRVDSVIGIEAHAAAVEDATASAALNGIRNARFVAGDVASHLRDIQRGERGDAQTVDIVVLNPPRKGCDPAVLQTTVALRPRAIAYLSCAPPTLVRDLTALARLGYRTTGVIPFDMLPHTPHLEALAFLVGAHT